MLKLRHGCNCMLLKVQKPKESHRVIQILFVTLQECRILSLWHTDGGTTNSVNSDQYSTIQQDYTLTYLAIAPLYSYHSTPIGR